MKYSNHNNILRLQLMTTKMDFICGIPRIEIYVSLFMAVFNITVFMY